MDFKKTIKKWEAENLISSEQSQKMLLDLSQQEKENKNSQMIVVVSTIGALLLGLGAILFFSSNWEKLPKITKLFLATLLPIIPLVTAYFLIFVKKNHEKLGYAFVLLGSLLIGASIAIIGQVYNTETNPKVLFGIWSLFTIPLIYIFTSKIAAAISSILVTIFIFFVIVDINNEYIFPYIPYIYIGYGILLFLFSEWHKQYLKKIYKEIAKIYELVAIKVILIASFILTLGFFNKESAVDNPVLFGDFQRFGYNVLFVALLATLFYLGNKRGDGILVNSAFLWTWIFIIFRYYDFFWDMLDVSLFFIGGGILLVGLSIFLEKKREKMIKSFKKVIE